MSLSAYQSRQAAAETPVGLELRLIGFVTQALGTARDPVQRIRALQRNHDMWLAFISDLAGEGNALPREVRAQLISLGLWSMRTSLDAMSDPDRSLQSLIDVNKEIAGGLADQTRAQQSAAQQAALAASKEAPSVTAV
ncbi:flagellar biosynthesis regulator FlaF [Oleisolibacter albus]|uniref:flagellar biosynthesis regulator FlaF n=1 Tax=Oleisolibacter albus TaxID=2171757 RepID=UPI0013903306|nr:flagellar biosynthesis regulator FlaF [Oleisolibacter albus]